MTESFTTEINRSTDSWITDQRPAEAVLLQQVKKLKRSKAAQEIANKRQ